MIRVCSFLMTALIFTFASIMKVYTILFTLRPAVRAVVLIILPAQHRHNINFTKVLFEFHGMDGVDVMAVQLILVGKIELVLIPCVHLPPLGPDYDSVVQLLYIMSVQMTLDHENDPSLTRGSVSIGYSSCQSSGIHMQNVLPPYSILSIDTFNIHSGHCSVNTSQVNKPYSHSHPTP